MRLTNPTNGAKSSMQPTPTALNNQPSSLSPTTHPSSPARRLPAAPIASGIVGAALFAMPQVPLAASRVIETVSSMPVKSSIAYAILCGGIFCVEKFAKPWLAKILPDNSLLSRMVQKTDVGLTIMAGGMSMAGIEMLYNSTDRSSEHFLHAQQDMVFAGCFIASVVSFKGLAEHFSNTRSATFWKGLNWSARAICYVDDALHPMLALMRWGMF